MQERLAVKLTSYIQKEKVMAVNWESLPLSNKNPEKEVSTKYTNISIKEWTEIKHIYSNCQ